MKLSTIILITATPSLEDLNQEINFIKDSHLAIHLVTFSKMQSPGMILKLAEFGGIFSSKIFPKYYCLNQL